MKTILITNDPVLAREAERAGVSRIMVDLESHGKKERQASRTTFISTHRMDDIAGVREVLQKAELIVRINPWHADSQDEIDHAIAAGAGRIMLPMITDLTQIDHFIAALKGRAKPLPLIETAYSMEQLGAIAKNPAIDELYIGLNDLHLSLGLDFLFEPLALGLVDIMAGRIQAVRKPFGFGGIGAMGGSGELPAERVLAEHARLESSCVILSSRFGKDIQLENPEGRLGRLKTALNTLHATYQALSSRTAEQQEADAKATADIIQKLAQAIKQKRAQA